MNEFIARPIEGGYSWTLTTRLGQILKKAESEFGKRDASYTILGIEFADNGPQIWYPGNCGYIAIQLSTCAIGNPSKACYQLAHECIHLLSPQGHRSANVLEEGLATAFAESYVKTEFGVVIRPGLQCYAEASDLARVLLSLDTNAIKTLRDTEPAISKITHEQVVSAFPEVGEDIAIQLCAPFERVT